MMLDERVAHVVRATACKLQIGARGDQRGQQAGRGRRDGRRGLVLDDVRFRAMTPAERRAVLSAMARLLLEAGGVAATREVIDDNA